MKVWVLCSIVAVLRLSVDAFISKASPSNFPAVGRNLAASRIVPKAVVEHFQGNPAVLFEQVGGAAAFITSGYVWSGKENTGSEEEEKESKEAAEIDIYRDTPLRYMGYANELGEAFRPLINVNFVYLGYVLAFGYVFADAASKALQAPKKYEQNFKASGRNSNVCAIPALLEVLTFQVMASVVLPGFTINRWVLFLGFVVDKYNAEVQQLPDLVTYWAPTLGGLALIPFIVKPLDFMVEKFLEATLIPFLEERYPLCETLPEPEPEPVPAKKPFGWF